MKTFKRDEKTFLTTMDFWGDFPEAMSFMY